jgi:DNA-binding beta-propeller fold protein YncE
MRSSDSDPSPMIKTPSGLTHGAHGLLYICDWQLHRILLVDSHSTGGRPATPPAAAAADAKQSPAALVSALLPGRMHPKVLTGSVAGYRDGPLNEALFRGPTRVCYDATNDALFVADSANNAIRKIDLAKGQVSTVLGGSERVGGVDLNRPYDVAVDALANLYVADRLNGRVVVFHQHTATVEYIGGLREPTAIAFHKQLNCLFVTEVAGNRVVRVDWHGAGPRVAHAAT